MFLNGLPTFAGEITKHIAEIDELRLVDLGGRGDSDGAGVLENFSDQGLRVLTKILEAAPALVGGPIDDILAALIAARARELGIESEGLEQQESTTEAAPEEPPPAQLEAEVPAEEATPLTAEAPPEETEEKPKKARPKKPRKRQTGQSE